MRLAGAGLVGGCEEVLQHRDGYRHCDLSVGFQKLGDAFNDNS